MKDLHQNGSTVMKEKYLKTNYKIKRRPRKIQAELRNLRRKEHMPIGTV